MNQGCLSIDITKNGHRQNMRAIKGDIKRQYIKTLKGDV